MSIPPRFLDEIRARVSVSEIVGRSVKLIKAGREYKGCCPFHSEKTPSFTVNDDKQFYHCFGCGEHGDVIKFLQKNNNMGFMDAVETLAAQAGLQVPKATPQEVEKAKKANNLYDLMAEVTAFFRAELQKPENRDVMDYVLSRGMSAAEQETFQIGFAPANRQAVRKMLSAEGYTDKDMIEAGVIKPSSKGGDPYAFFNDRVMFPVTDRRGRVIAFGGRALPEHMRPPSQSSFKPPKYINSGDTVLFDKGRNLYALPQARQASGDGKPIIVTEGYMDVIACHAAGFTGAVAPMGTALTEEQIILLWKIIADDHKLPILCFDGDNAGRKAAARSVERIMPLLRPAHSVRFAFLPEGKDPDDLLKESGAIGFQKILDSAVSLLDFLWFLNTSGRDLSTPEARAGVSADLKKAIATIADSDVQRHYNALIQERINETFFARKSFGGGSYNNRGRGGFKPKSVLKPRMPQFRDVLPKALLAGVLNHPHIYESIEEDFSHIAFFNDDLNKLRTAAADILNAQSYNEDERLDNAALQSHLKEQGFEKEMGDILSEAVYIHAAFTAPQANPDEVEHNWMDLFASWKGKLANREIKDGWKKAFETANEDEERALSSMVMAAQTEKTDW